MAEIAFLCRDWSISTDCDMSREEKSTITSPTLDTPNSHIFDPRTESSDTHTSCLLDARVESNAALETPTHMAAEKSGTHLTMSVADGTSLAGSSISITTPPVSEFFADTSQCVTVFDGEMVVTPVVDNTTETSLQDDTELKGEDEVSIVATLPVGSITTPPVSESFANTSQCLLEEQMVLSPVVNNTTTETSVKVDMKGNAELKREDEEVSVVAALSATETADSANDEDTVDCSTTAEAKYNLSLSKFSENTTKAGHLPSESDVICVSTNQSPVICISTSSEENKPGSEPDKICLSEAGSDDVLLFSDPPTPSDDILQGTVSGELSPSSVVDLGRRQPISSVKTTPHVCSSPSSPVIIDVSPDIEQHPQVDLQLHCPVELPVELGSVTEELPKPSPTPHVDFKTPHVERSASSKQDHICKKLTTPACTRLMLESDDNITPMPAYQTMPTPILKVSYCTHKDYHVALVTLLYLFLCAGGVF